MAPIFTGPDGVGVGVTVVVSMVVGVGVGSTVVVDAVVGVAVAVVVTVGAVVSPLLPPQAANIGTIKTKARARAMNLYHIFPFGHMVNHLLLLHR